MRVRGAIRMWLVGGLLCLAGGGAWASEIGGGEGALDSVATVVTVVTITVDGQLMRGIVHDRSRGRRADKKISLSRHKYNQYVWTYSPGLYKGFEDSEKYQKNKHFASSELKGAWAAAFWAEFDTHRVCERADDIGACRREKHCYVKVFLPKGAPLPYTTGRVTGYRARSEDDSLRFLPLRPGDLEAERLGVGFADDAVAAVVGGEERAARVYLYDKKTYLDMPFVMVEFLDCDIESGKSLGLRFKDARGEAVHEVAFDESFVERAAAGQALEDEPIMVYDTWIYEMPPLGRLIPQEDGSYLEDIHTWAYSRAFAEEFGMPEEFIDEELQGAEAIAQRIELNFWRLCDGFGLSGCSLGDRCFVDVYVPAKKDLKVPPFWRDGMVMLHALYYDKPHFRILPSKHPLPQDFRWWDHYQYSFDGESSSQEIKTRIYRPTGNPRGSGFVGGRTDFGYYNAISLPGYKVLTFNRCLYSEVYTEEGGFAVPSKIAVKDVLTVSASIPWSLAVNKKEGYNEKYDRDLLGSERFLEAARKFYGRPQATEAEK